MLFNVISHWPDILKTLAAIVVFVSGTSVALNVLFTLIGATAKLLGLDAVALVMTKCATAVSWFGAEVHVLAIKYGILPPDTKPAPASGGATPSGSAYRVAVDDSEPPVAKPRARISWRRGLFFAFMIFVPGFLVRSMTGCALFQSKQPQFEHAAVDIGVCVLEHAIAGESVKQIADDCGQIAEQDVIDILAAHKKLAAAEASSAHASSCPVGK